MNDERDYPHQNNTRSPKLDKCHEERPEEKPAVTADATTPASSSSLQREFWKRGALWVDSPDFIRSDFYFFKFVWRGLNAAYPSLSSEQLEIFTKAIKNLEGMCENNEYAIFYRLCRPKPSDTMKVEIVGVTPFFPTDYEIAAQFLAPMDKRETIILIHLCAEWGIRSRSHGKHNRPFIIPTSLPSENNWPHCWPGDKRFPENNWPKNIRPSVKNMFGLSGMDDGKEFESGNKNKDFWIFPDA